MNGFTIDVTLTRRANGSEPFTLQAGFETPAGITALCGPSGAGKSTLLRSILGDLRPDRGHVAAAGHTVFDAERGVDIPVHRRGIGMVFQRGALFPHMSVAENVRFAAGDHGLAMELLERVGAADWGTRRPGDLSGGQRQRVALARALAARPRALLLDEPFSALDRAARTRLGNLLRELQSLTGVPFLHVTHDHGEALHLATHLVLLEAGRVVDRGDPETVLDGPGGHRETGENLFRAEIVRHDDTAGYSEIARDGIRLFCSRLDREIGTRAVFSLRSRDPLLAVAPPGPTSARNVLAGTIRSIECDGPGRRVTIETPHPLRVSVTPSAVEELELAPGKRVYLLIKASAVRCLT